MREAAFAWCGTSVARDDAHPPQRLTSDRDVVALHEVERAITADAEHGEVGGNDGRRVAVAAYCGVLIAHNEQAPRGIEGVMPPHSSCSSRVDHCGG